jgi:hypothetical protein
VSPVSYELGFYISEDDTLHSDRRRNLKSYMSHFCLKPKMNQKLMKSFILDLTVKVALVNSCAGTTRNSLRHCEIPSTWTAKF